MVPCKRRRSASLYLRNQYALVPLPCSCPSTCALLSPSPSLPAAQLASPWLLLPPSHRQLQRASDSCGDGFGADNEASSAAARTSCYASVAVDTYAKALATANIAAECGYWQDARVTADVMAEVGSDLYVSEACSFVEDREGLTGASAAGSARTRAVSLSPLKMC